MSQLELGMFSKTILPTQTQVLYNSTYWSHNGVLILIAIPTAVQSRN